MRQKSVVVAVIATIAGIALLAGCARAANAPGSGSTAGSPTQQGTMSTAAESTTTPQTSSNTAESTTATETSGANAGQPCVTANLKASLGEPEGAAGSSYYTLTFTNVGTVSCTLQGFPGVSYVTGESGTQVGASAAWDGTKGSAVTVLPGGTATAQLQEVDVYNFPPSVCDPTGIRGLRIYPPGEKSALYVPQQGGVGCKADPLPGGQFQMSVKTITAS